MDGFHCYPCHGCLRGAKRQRLSVFLIQNEAANIARDVRCCYSTPTSKNTN